MTHSTHTWNEPMVASGAWDRCATCLATGLGVGYARWAPGTWGTLWGVPLTWGILRLPGWGWQLAAIGLLYAVGVSVCGRAARYLDRKDPGCVVWDEFSALPIVFLGLSADALSRPEIVVLGFGLFRVFDISKIPPVRQFERLPGGWGIMSDDTAAAIYALAVMVTLRWLIPWLG